MGLVWTFELDIVIIMGSGEMFMIDEWIRRGEPKVILCYYDMMIRISSSMLVYLS